MTLSDPKWRLVVRWDASSTILRGHLVTFVTNSKRVVWSLLNPGQCDSQERSRTAERKTVTGAKWNVTAMFRDHWPWPRQDNHLRFPNKHLKFFRGIRRAISRKLVKISLTAGYLGFLKTVPSCRVSRHLNHATDVSYSSAFCLECIINLHWSIKLWKACSTYLWQSQ